MLKPGAAARTPPPAPGPEGRKRSRKRLQIDLALQGGGSHGAFTWGVLDRLLEEEWLEFSAISGTSAGAMNAVAMAAGLMEDGRAGARRVLRELWRRLAASSPFHPWQAGPLGAGLGAANPWLTHWLAPLTAAATQWSSQFSPYQLNPLNLNPLREILIATIDFERVRDCSRSQLFVAATHVRTGALRVFDQCDLSADVVLASSCLPLLFQAVEIDGEAYWDGGYAGNPSLLPLISDTVADDLLLVQINPLQRDQIPTSADGILDRINEVTFNASLLKELRTIALLQQLLAQQPRTRQATGSRLFDRIQSLRVHLLDGGASLAAFSGTSKTDTQWHFLTRLHALGRDAAERWLAEHGAALGRRSSFDPATVLHP